MRTPRLGRALPMCGLLFVFLTNVLALPAEAQVASAPSANGMPLYDFQSPAAPSPPQGSASPGLEELNQGLFSAQGGGQHTAAAVTGVGGQSGWNAAPGAKPGPTWPSSGETVPGAPTSPLPAGVWENRYVARRGDGTFFLLPGESVFKLDYRLRWLTDSHTSYEFGTPELPPDGWTPLSRLVFSLDSLWHGVGVGWERPGWNVRFEWLTPMQRRVQGDLEDYDWFPPNPDGSFTDLGVMRQRWTDAQMLDLTGQFRLLDRPLSLPLEVWPGAGFRWQRLGLMASDPFQLKEFNVWQEYPWSYYGDVIAFKQEYFVGYVGGEIRATLEGWRLPPLQVTFRGDWGWTDGYNIDHHLIREGDRYTKESTHGDTWRVGMTFETLVRRCLSLGFEVDYLEFATKGRHHLINIPEGQDLTWDHGVRAWSDQTWLTAFLRLRI